MTVAYHQEHDVIMTSFQHFEYVSTTFCILRGIKLQSLHS